MWWTSDRKIGDGDLGSGASEPGGTAHLRESALGEDAAREFCQLADRMGIQGGRGCGVDGSDVRVLT